MYEYYNTSKIKHNEVEYDSKLELRVYLILEGMQKNGKIRQLTTKPIIVLDEGCEYYDFLKRKMVKQQASKYIPDFSFYSIKTKMVEFVEVKGYMTPVAKLKVKMARARGHVIHVVYDEDIYHFIDYIM